MPRTAATLLLLVLLAPPWLAGARASEITELFAGYGKTARIPTLWIYTENDRYFAPRHARSWYDAFRAQGGNGELVLLPPHGEDGHLLFARGFSVWKPIVERFLQPHLPASATKDP